MSQTTTFPCCLVNSKERHIGAPAESLLKSNEAVREIPAKAFAAMGARSVSLIGSLVTEGSLIRPNGPH